VTEYETPELLCDVFAVSGEPEQDGGALWRLAVAQRHLDANVIGLAAGKRIDTHAGPDLDVLMLVVGGAGEVVGADAALQVAAGSLVWLPRRSQRSIVAGPDGLRYLTVHPRRPALSIGTTRP
jgi:quercetin dioxygenase-like cupin family protein